MTEALAWVKWRFDRWMADPGLRICSLAARGLWIDLIAIMHACEPYGHLVINGRSPAPRQIAAMVGMTTEEQVAALLRELEEAGVFSRSAEGLIFCRKMVRDRQSAEAGEKRPATNAERQRRWRERNGRNAAVTRGVTPEITGVTLTNNTDITVDVGNSLARSTACEAHNENNNENNAVEKETESDTESETELKKKETSLRDAKKRATQVPANWQPTADGVAYAKARGLTPADVEHFRDHYRSQGKPMLDWDLTWKNWCRNAVRFGTAPLLGLASNKAKVSV